jgi:Fe-Mn family superoxide dismutase
MMDRRYQMKPLSCDPARIKGMSERLIISHYENNYGGAVKRLNLIDERLAELDFANAAGFLINGLKREQLIATNSMILHELFFDGLGDQSEPKVALRDAIARDFGSFERWRAEFVAMGKALGGGSGGYCCRGRRAIAGWSINGLRTIAILWQAERRFWGSICTSIPITWTSAPKRPVTSIRLWKLSAGKMPIICTVKLLVSDLSGPIETRRRATKCAS